MALLLALVTVSSDVAAAPLLIGVAVTAALLITSLVLVAVPTAVTRVAAHPGRARAPGVILTSTHPATAGHPKPRAPGGAAVAAA